MTYQPTLLTSAYAADFAMAEQSSPWYIAAPTAIVTTALNAGYSLATIPLDIANAFGAGIQKDGFSSVLRDLDSGLGTNLDSFYAAHKDGVDLAGFAVASLLPGLGGVKALGAAAGAGKGVNFGKAVLGEAAATGVVPTTLQRYTGLGTRISTEGLTAALNAVQTSSYTALNANMLKMVAGGAINLTAETLAFNAAATATLFNSPYLEGKSSTDLIKDIVHDSFSLPVVGLGAVFGTTFNKGAQGFSKNLGIATDTRDGYLGYLKSVKPAETEIRNLQSRGISPQFAASLSGSTGGTAMVSLLEEAARLRAELPMGVKGLTGAGLGLRQANFSSAISDLETKTKQTFVDLLTKEAATTLKTADPQATNTLYKQLTTNPDAAYNLAGVTRVKTLGETGTQDKVYAYYLAKEQRYTLDAAEAVGSKSAREMKPLELEKLISQETTKEAAQADLTKLFWQNPLTGEVESLVNRAAKASDAFVDAKIIRANRAYTMFLDLNTGAFTNSIKGITAADLDSKTISSFRDLQQSFTITNLQTATALEAEHSLRLAFKRTVAELNQFATRGFNENQLPLMEAWLHNTSTVDTAKFLGKDVTRDEMAEIIALRKSKLADDLLEQGFTDAEVSKMINSEGTAGYEALLAAKRKPILVLEYGKNAEDNAGKRLVGSMRTDVQAKMEYASEKAAVASRKHSLLAAEGLDATLPQFAQLDKNVTIDTKLGVAGALLPSNSKVADRYSEWVVATTKAVEEFKGQFIKNRVESVQAAVTGIVAKGKGGEAATELAGTHQFLMSRGEQGMYTLERSDGKLMLLDGGVYLKAVKDLALKNAAIKAGAKELGIDATPRLVEINAETLLATAKADLRQGLDAKANVYEVKTDELAALYRANNVMTKAAESVDNTLATLRSPVTVMRDGIETYQGVHKFHPPAPDLRTTNLALLTKAPSGHELTPNQTRVYLFADVEDLRKAQIYWQSKGYGAYTTKESNLYQKSLDQYEATKGFSIGAIDDMRQNKNKQFVADEGVADILERYTSYTARRAKAQALNLATEHFEDSFLRLSSHDAYLRNTDSSLVGAKIKSLLNADARTGSEKVIDTILGTPNRGIAGQLMRLPEVGLDHLSNFVRDWSNNASFESRAKTLDAVTNNAQSLGMHGASETVISAMLETNKVQSKVVSEAIGHMSGLLYTTMLKLDPLNLVANVMGQPIMASPMFAQYIKGWEARGIDTTKLKDLLKIPAGEGLSTLAMTKLLAESHGVPFFKAKASDHPEMLEMLKSFGYKPPKETLTQGNLAIPAKDPLLAQVFLDLKLTRNPAEVQRQELMDKLLDTGKGQAFASERNIVNKVNDMADSVQEFMLTNKFAKGTTRALEFGEASNQFSVAYVAARMASALDVSPKEKYDFMINAIHKIEGNMTQAQKGTLTQGTTGGALALFQSYQFRVIQRLTEHLESGDKKLLMSMAALQSGFFGTKQLPGFEYLNKSIISEGNADRQDIYSSAYNLMPRDVANFILYGAGSSMLQLNISGRGGVEPRQWTILPTSLEQIPVVNALWTTGKQVAEFGSNIVGGAPVGEQVAHALQHNAWSRPLRETAKFAAGYSTTAKGGLEVDLVDAKWNTWNTARMLGARPLDEAVTLDTVYRYQQYQAVDRADREKLAVVLKANKIAGKDLNESLVADLSRHYANAGGSIENYNKWMVSTYANAGLDSGERLRKTLNNKGYQKQAQYILGRQIEDTENITTAPPTIITDQ